jgi:shikimate dehydrogenase
VIGDPVTHSLSPALHNAAFAALGIDWVYVAFPVPAGQAGPAVEAMRTLGLVGLSVTMPHKAAVVPFVDRLGPAAERLGVVNTIARAPASYGSSLVGDSTDGGGFLDALTGDGGFEPAAKRCVVLGAGGAARSVTVALADAGAAEVAVVGRNGAAVETCAALAGARGATVPAAGATAAVSGADLVVNATPVGMHGREDAAGILPFGLEARCLSSHQFVVDLVYHPATTPLLAAARARGATAVNGLGMLIHQAARQVEMWTGRQAPLEAMSAAAIGALGHTAG